MLIYTIDKADKTREPTRKITIEFFKNSLDFKDQDIILVDRNEFCEDKDGNGQTKFSDETKEAMKRFARRIFGDIHFGLANQILHVALCEC